MFPTYIEANEVRVKKLNGLDGRVFTAKDAELAMKVSKDLGVKISELKS